MTQRRVVLAAGLTAALPLACGGETSAQAPSITEVVEATENAGSSRIDEDSSWRGFGEWRSRGIVDIRRSTAHLTYTFVPDPGLDANQKALVSSFDRIGETIVVGGRTFMSYDGPGAPPGKRWFEESALQDLGPDLVRFDMLRAARGDLEQVGDENVRGVETTHYRGEIDYRTLVEQASKERREALREELARRTEEGGVTIPLDVWIDADGLVRRYRTSDGAEVTTVELYDFGVEVDVEAPPPGQVMTAAEHERAEEASRSRSFGSDRPVAARFITRTTYSPDWKETAEGIFDWGTRTGRLVTTGGGDRTELIQIGDRCFERSGDGPWKTSKADDVGGLCSVELESPAGQLQLTRAVASEFERVGEASVRGVTTTHYRGRLNIGAVEGPVELWVDREVRRSRMRGEEKDSFVTETEYFDFGVDVEVEAPVR